MSISKTDDMYCFTAKKWSVSKGCYYSIALDQDDAKRAKASSSMPESYVGKVRSDRKAQEYTLYDDGASFDGKEKGGKSELRCELLHVNFSNSLRNRNPGAMTVVVPEVDSEGGMVPARPKDAAGQLNERLKRGDLGGLMELKNREPKWNPTSNMYQLDVHGRATLASCKNIQLHPKRGGEVRARLDRPDGEARASACVEVERRLGGRWVARESRSPACVDLWRFERRNGPSEADTWRSERRERRCVEVPRPAAAACRNGALGGAAVAAERAESARKFDGVPAVGPDEAATAPSGTDIAQASATASGRRGKRATPGGTSIEYQHTGGGQASR
ncbi:hypothetical protein EMIHUDRAFT_213307 [Emiliania huxleyi CCMP1516]|uniref:Tubby C-terminal domain-containing protein n=2 Tax=Emiliania huxleyi TaxID=2903 RepID=A0A0D3IMW8_EMIH1|nr:hypothetical protein EMIHUDRAFT_213307 [Emiliania huxleyi CCMP1516]EOD12603.1 hypothetical protein EMIHUDRAFT_213307 [Emiliania huxleyi CCMP1516]|eukprot:XP_005765032.1 hypothetical protein EMIHUDRAFT_213307 [Emiliania huxleyi CCMP1516]